VQRALIVGIGSIGIVTMVAMLVMMAMAADAQPDSADGIQEGERVTLVERDADIPAHPAPQDRRVPFRFQGGSSALVLSIDIASGWIQIRGEGLDGEDAVGWIIRRYINGALEDVRARTPGKAASELAWCPAMTSPNPYADGTLRLATWNIANLHARDGDSTFGPPRPSVRRDASDYRRLRCYVRLLDPDVLAVQEIDGEEALARVVDTEVYDLHVSGRGKTRDMNGRQNTGFAYKKGLNVARLPDFDALDVGNGGLRHGARISVAYGDEQLQLMSVHLKSGCFGNTVQGRDCARLLRQVPVLEEWIDQHAAGPDPLIVLGDFNRRLNDRSDAVWAELDDGRPANAELTAVTEDHSINCRDNRFPGFVDHIVFGLRSIDFVDPSSFRQMNFRTADQPHWDAISDHCPVVIDLRSP
jgi:endonuclease/exonuclease/phosphatase family metal-dependent hydrolase